METREMTDKLQDLRKRATETARNLSEVTDRYVRDNAWVTLACIAVVGCIIGYALARRRD